MRINSHQLVQLVDDPVALVIIDEATGAELVVKEPDFPALYDGLQDATAGADSWVVVTDTGQPIVFLPEDHPRVRLAFAYLSDALLKFRGESR